MQDFSTCLSDFLPPLLESDFTQLQPEKFRHALGLKKVLLFGFLEQFRIEREL